MESHLLNSIYVILDAFVTATPVRLVHVIYNAIVGTTYLVFTVVYWAAGGVNMYGKPYIYSVLDWSKPDKAAPIAVGAVVVGIPVTHVLLWGLYMARLALHRTACGGGQQGCVRENRKVHLDGNHSLNCSGRTFNDCPV